MASAILLAAGQARAGQVSFDNLNTPTPLIVDGVPIPAETGTIAIGASDFSDSELAGINDSRSLEEFVASFLHFAPSVRFTALFGPSTLAGLAQQEFGAEISSDSPLVGKNVLIVIGSGNSIADSDHLAIIRSETTFDFDNPAFSAVVMIDQQLGANAEIVLGTHGTLVEFPEFAVTFTGIELQKIAPLPPATTIEPISSIAMDDAGLQLTIPIAFRRTIGVEYSATGEAGSWTTLGNFAKINREVAVFTDPDFIRLGRQRGFYRAVLRPLPSL